MTSSSASSQSLKLQRVDLPKSHARRLFFSTECDSTSACGEVLLPLLGEGDMFVSGSPYTIGRKKHLITARVDRLKDETEEFAIRVSYDATSYPDRVTVPREDQREGEFLAQVLQLTEPMDFMCNIEFEFPEAEESALWFPLPSRIGGTTGAAETFEIVGVQAAKLPEETTDELGYYFSLSRVPEGPVFLDLYFSFSLDITLETPKKILTEGLAIASRLVGARTVRKRLNQ
jgi:hypothetical protein